MAAENLKSLLGSLKAVERSGDISQRHFGGINDHIDSLDGDNMLTGGSTLDGETLSHYVDGGGSSSLRSVRDSSNPSKSGRKKAMNRELSKKNLQRSGRVAPLKVNKSEPLLRAAGAGGSDPPPMVAMIRNGGKALVDNDELSVGSAGSFSVASSLTAMSSTYGGSTTDVAHSLRSVSSNKTKPSVKRVHSEIVENLGQMSLKEQEEATASLMRDIVTGSKLLSGTGPDNQSKFNPQMESHLKEFKRGYDAMHAKPVKLPSITTLADPAMEKKIAVAALAGPPSEDEVQLAEHYLTTVSNAKRGKIYADISDMVTLSNIQKTKDEAKHKREMQEKAKALALRGPEIRRKADGIIGDDRMSITSSSLVSGSLTDGGSLTTGPSRDYNEGEDDAYSVDSDLYSDTDSDSESELSEDEKKRKAAKALRKSRKLKARRKIEERKMRRRLEGVVEEKDSGDEEAEAGGEKALGKLASTYIKEDASGKVILDASASEFFDKMATYRKNEEIRANMRVRMAEEEEEAERLQEERLALAAQASALTAADGASASDSPSTSSSPPASASSPAGKSSGTMGEAGAGRDRKQSVVLQKLEASSGYALGGSSSNLPATGLGLERSSGIDRPESPPTGVTIGEDGEIKSSLLKHGHERDLAKDIASLSTSAQIPGEAGGKPVSAYEGKSLVKRGRSKSPKRDLNMFIPPGGPLVIGTVQYGLPYGLGLKGSGLAKPMAMTEVVNFQESLENPSKQPLHHFLKKQRDEASAAAAAAEKEAAVGEEDMEKAEATRREREDAKARKAQREAGLSPHMLARLREEEDVLGDSSLSTPLASGRDSLEGRGSAAASCAPSQSSLSHGLEREHQQLAQTLKAEARKNATIASKVLTRYQDQRKRYDQVQSEYQASERAHEPWMDAYKWGLHDDIGLDIDAKFMQKQLAEKAIRLMMFYIMEVQLKNAFTFLRDQTRRVANAKLLNAAALINRIGRGMLARKKCRLLMRMMRERLEAQRKKDRYAAAYQRKMVRIITRNIRLYAKMRTVKRNLRRRRAATAMQRVARGKLARLLVRNMRARLRWLNQNALKVQCSFRQHLARRRIILFKKLLLVKTLMDDIESEKLAVKEAHRTDGAQCTIKRYYRASKCRAALKKLIFWNRFDKAITLQKHTRGHAARKYVKALLKVKRAKEKRVFDAAALMQKYIRGVNARKAFAGMMHRKRLEVARKRMLKKEYLDNHAVNGAKAMVLLGLRKMMPFRYILTWSKALRIQRFWRGHRSRRRVYLMIIRRKIAADNAYFFGKHKGATHMQRIFRGFRVRRGLMREARLGAAWKIQCCFRQFSARQVKTMHKVRRDAITLLSRNIFLMLKFRKNLRIRKDAKRFTGPALVVQRLWRKALGRKRVRDLKDKKRSDMERTDVTELRLRYILASIQLRMLMESFKRDLGKRPFDACAQECVALGPVQALYLAAVGPKSRLGNADDLLSNKLDNTNFQRFAAKIKGLTVKGRAADTPAQLKQAALIAAANARAHAEAANPSTTSGGDGGKDATSLPPTGAKGSRPTSRTAAGSSRERSHGKGGGRAGPGASDGPGPGPGPPQQASLLTIPSIPEGSPSFNSFSLLDAVMCRDVPTILTDVDYTAARAYTSLSNSDIDMTASKAKAEGSGNPKEMTYHDFVLACRTLGEQHYSGSTQWQERREIEVALRDGSKKGGIDATTAAAAAAAAAAGAGASTDAGMISGTDSESGSDSDATSDEESSEEGGSLDSDKMTRKKRRSHKKRKKKISRDSGSDTDSTASSENADAGQKGDSEANAALLEMQKQDLAKNIANAKGASAMTGKTRDNAFSTSSWRAKQLVWPMTELTSRRPNMQLIMVIKMLDSLRLEPWFVHVATWMELESRARLSRYVAKMRGLYYHMKSAVFRNIMKDRIAARAQLEIFNAKVTHAQRYVRRYIYKRRVQQLAQALLVKYIPDIGDPYYYNSRTRFSSTTKPKVLGRFECLSISLPPAGLEYVIKCSNCLENVATMNCAECEDSYCRSCYDDLHCKGRRREHTYVAIPYCGYCKYQHACFSCLTCMTTKPDPDSPHALLSESERGLACDSCFSHMHDEHAHALEAQSDEIKSGVKAIFEKTREAYLVRHQIHVALKTDHQYFNVVQECEECGSHSAQWRCLDCKQVYCNKCLTALHSMGGPFTRHKSERLPYYSKEMHKSYLDDQRSQVFKTRMEEVNKLWAEKNAIRRARATIQLQSWWRMVRGARDGRKHMLAVRKAERRRWRLRQREAPIRNSMKYQIMSLLGIAPHLLSDTVEEDILRSISVFGKQFAREYIWRNKDDWGHYKIGKGKDARFARKGVPRTGFDIGTREELAQQARCAGFDIGTREELAQQARCGGYRLPGYVLVKKGESQLTTTYNLKPLLKPGMLVKCGIGYFKIRAVGEDYVVFDRVWRFTVYPSKEERDAQRANRNPNREMKSLVSRHTVDDGLVGREVMYRLPVYADEPRKYTYKVYYLLSNYSVSNPLSQVYFSLHSRLFATLADTAESIQALHRRLGFRRGAKGWEVTAAIQNRRAKWAHDLLNGDDDIDDLGAVTTTGKSAKRGSGKKIAPEKEKKKKKAKGKGIRPKEDENETDEDRLKREQEEEEVALAAFMGDSVDLDEINGEDDPDSRPTTREEGERWVATKEEAEARLKLESAMTPEELASHADEWSEHVDPMTENVFWVHDETNEMSMDMPASIKTRNRLAEEKEKNEKMHREALERMAKNAAGGKSGKGGGFKKKR